MKVIFRTLPTGNGMFWQWKWKHKIHQIAFIKTVTTIE